MIDSVLLGIIQGLTEFLPISSSGHLVFLQSLLGWSAPEIWFDIVLHLATLVAVVFYFRRDIVNVIVNDRRTIGLIVAGSAPTALIGWFGKDFVEHTFSSVSWAAFFLVITGVLLFLTRHFGKSNKNMKDFSVWAAVVVGVMQGFAILPGISRSGSTIAMGIFLGWEKTQAARFSFLLSIPAILGATILGFKEFSAQATLPISSYIIGFAAAFISGVAALYVLFRILLRNKLSNFAYYCWIMGITIYVLSR